MRPERDRRGFACTGAERRMKSSCARIQLRQRLQTSCQNVSFIKCYSQSKQCTGARRQLSFSGLTSCANIVALQTASSAASEPTLGSSEQLFTAAEWSPLVTGAPSLEGAPVSYDFHVPETTKEASARCGSGVIANALTRPAKPDVAHPSMPTK